jgi:hypothetical protein
VVQIHPVALMKKKKLKEQIKELKKQNAKLSNILYEMKYCPRCGDEREYVQYLGSCRCGLT